MSINAPDDVTLYGPGIGRGDVEAHVIQTIQTWLVTYIASYERLVGLPPRSIPVPPTPESISGNLDFTPFSSGIFPQLIVVVQPVGEVERYGEFGTYGSWFEVRVAATVMVEGDQDQTRALADAYGTVLQKLLPQKGGLGLSDDGTQTFAVRTRLQAAYGLAFPGSDVRDVVQAIVVVRTFVENLVDDLLGPVTVPLDPYADPGAATTANEVEVALVRGDPDTVGNVTADAVVLDGNVNPPVIRYEQVTVTQPEDAQADILNNP